MIASVGIRPKTKVVFTGTPLSNAHAAMIMVHGRGATAESILELARVFPTEGFAFVAPQAENSAWYPNSFLAPIESNEPGISNGLNVIRDVVKEIETAGIPSDKIIILGFSQGACLALEFAARNAKRWGGVAGLSGGLIGHDVTPRNYPGSLDATPVFLGCSDIDFHIPAKRVKETAAVLTSLGGKVTMRLYPGMEHTVNDDEIEYVSGMLRKLTEKE